MMRFGGWQRSSLIDFPGKISLVLFTQGCPFRCPFCHNPTLVLPEQYTTPHPTEEEVFSFLATRKGKLDGVVISGGEPTIQPDLPAFIATVKQMGFTIKVDTNGSRPAMVERLLANSTVDYWAIDRKSSLARYHLATGVAVDPSAIQRSSQLVMEATDQYEFRTTVIREWHPLEEIIQMAQELSGARRWILQRFRPDVTLDPALAHATAYTNEEMDTLCASAKPYVTECSWR